MRRYQGFSSPQQSNRKPNLCKTIKHDRGSGVGRVRADGQSV
nr:MAG TPA: hypothetical protein [Caudoviricetes sp.]